MFSELTYSVRHVFLRLGEINAHTFYFRNSLELNVRDCSELHEQM
jgi:hypothetical protein